MNYISSLSLSFSTLCVSGRDFIWISHKEAKNGANSNDIKNAVVFFSYSCSKLLFPLLSIYKKATIFQVNWYAITTTCKSKKVRPSVTKITV
jgi:hypothetical protein